MPHPRVPSFQRLFSHPHHRQTMLLSRCHCFSAPPLLTVHSAEIIAAGIMGMVVGSRPPVRVLEPKRALPPRKPGNFLFAHSPSPSPSQVAPSLFFLLLPPYFDLAEGALY